MTTLTTATTTTPTTTPSQIDYILLDGSGSMHGEKWWSACEAIDAYVDTLKSANLSSRLILHVFDDHDLELIHRDLSIDQWLPLMTHPVGAHWGGTPLYDAIWNMGQRIERMKSKPGHICIATDGEEGGSSVTEDQARGALNYLRALGWQITFIGCDFDNSRTARALGATKESAIGVARKLLPEAARELGKKRANWATYGTPMEFTDEERSRFLPNYSGN